MILNARLAALGLLAVTTAFARQTYPPSLVTNTSGQAWTLSIDDILVPVGVVRVWNRDLDMQLATLVSSGDKFTLKPRYSYYIEVCPSPKLLEKGVAITLGFHASQTPLSDFKVNVKQVFSKNADGQVKATAPRLSISPSKGAIVNEAGFQSGRATFIQLQ